jgi:hypothetical protein
MEGERGGRGIYVLLLGCKMVLALAAIGFVLYVLPVHLVGFMFGMGSLLIAAAVAALS